MCSPALGPLLCSQGVPSLARRCTWMFPSCTPWDNPCSHPPCSQGIPSRTSVSPSGCSATLGPPPERVHQLCPLVFPSLRALISLSSSPALHGPLSPVPCVSIPPPPQPPSPQPSQVAATLSPVPQVLPPRPERRRGGSHGPHGRRGGWCPKSPTPAGWWGRARVEKSQSISWTPGSGMSPEEEEEEAADP